MDMASKLFTFTFTFTLTSTRTYIFGLADWPVWFVLSFLTSNVYTPRGTEARQYRVNVNVNVNNTCAPLQIHTRCGSHGT